MLPSYARCSAGCLAGGRERGLPGSQGWRGALNQITGLYISGQSWHAVFSFTTAVVRVKINGTWYKTAEM
jgi:hypothetical protein